MLYPFQYFRLAIGDTDNNVIASGTSLSSISSYRKNKLKMVCQLYKCKCFPNCKRLNNQLINAWGNNVYLINNSNSDS